MADWVDVDLRLWGKSRGLVRPYPLVCHLLDAGAAVGALWDWYLPPSVHRFLAEGMGVDEARARQVLIFWAALHDIGKVMPCFQEQDKDAFEALTADYSLVAGERRSHGFAAHAWLATALMTLGYPESKSAAAYRVAQMLGGHHGCFSAPGREMGAPLVMLPELGDGEWEKQRKALTYAVHRIVGAPAPIEQISAAAAGLACGLVILADWLVSQDDFLVERLKRVPEIGDMESLTAHYEDTVRAVPDLLDSAGLGRLRLRPGGFEDEFVFEPNGLQRSIETTLPRLLSGGPGLLLLMAPMGDGKTEAALHGARLLGEAAGTPGIFFGLPTMATADQMYLRLGDYGRRRAEGPAALSLLHSMSWLNAAYQPDDPGTKILTGEDESASMEAAGWLQGGKRGLLAPWAVGTIDQALVAALCGRHNMLRMLGLAGKVLVVDEVHAYDSYMQHLLSQLLRWLGHLGAPVVLLSATLPKHVAKRLVEAYLAGAGHYDCDGFEVDYPGWLYADATTGHVHPVPIESRARTLAVSLREIPLDSDRSPLREGALKALLAPLVETGGGCVAVICNTVGEAQQTYRELGAWFEAITQSGGLTPDLELLHSRFPARQREEITLGVVAKYGKDAFSSGRRPRAAVVVATQVIEQSIDLDFDMIISDLAPVALLLQRAGRCWRHGHNPRPDWLPGPRLAVLAPVEVPRSWPYVYPLALLRRTRKLLLRRGDDPIRIPQDIQEVVDEVYDETFMDGGMADDDIERIADQQVKEAFAEMVAIPEPTDVMSLHELTDRNVDDKLFTTRLGADSARVLCCYVDQQGERFLNPACSVKLPATGSGKSGRFLKQEVKTLLGLSIPVPGAWVADRDDQHAPPGSWSSNTYLRDLILLPHTVSSDGQIRPADVGGKSFELHPRQGLLRLA